MDEHAVTLYTSVAAGKRNQTFVLIFTKSWRHFHTKPQICKAFIVTCMMMNLKIYLIMGQGEELICNDVASTQDSGHVYDWTVHAMNWPALQRRENN